MPKYLKDSKLEIWKCEPTQDKYGAWHDGEPYLAGTVWANVKGTDYSESFALSAHWADPILKATVTRPTWSISVGDHVRYKGEFYAIKSMDELTGKVGRDLKLIMQRDTRFKVAGEQG